MLIDVNLDKVYSEMIRVCPILHFLIFITNEYNKDIEVMVIKYTKLRLTASILHTRIHS